MLAESVPEPGTRTRTIMTNPATGHTLKKFDEELSTLRDLVLRMGGLVEDQLRGALAALDAADPAAAREIVFRDREIDRIELKADEEIAQLLALRTPLGIDLRTVLTLSKTVTDLERVGDEAKKVARSCDAAAALPREPFAAAIAEMGRLAAEQLHGALDALVRLDLDHAAAVKRGDKRLDRAFDAAVSAFGDQLAQQPLLAPQAVQWLFAAKALERIGDHAKNITQYVFYLVEGRDVRHPKAREP